MMDNCPDLASQHRLCCKDASLQSISLAIDELSYVIVTCTVVKWEVGRNLLVILANAHLFHCVHKHSHGPCQTSSPRVPVIFGCILICVG